MHTAWGEAAGPGPAMPVPGFSPATKWQSSQGLTRACLPERFGSLFLSKLVNTVFFELPSPFVEGENSRSLSGWHPHPQALATPV